MIIPRIINGSYICISNPIIYPIGPMVLLCMVTWIPSIYPSHVSIFLPAPAGSYGCGITMDNPTFRKGTSYGYFFSIEWDDPSRMEKTTGISSQVTVETIAGLTRNSLSHMPWCWNIYLQNWLIKMGRSW